MIFRAAACACAHERARGAPMSAPLSMSKCWTTCSVYENMNEHENDMKSRRRWLPPPMPPHAVPPRRAVRRARPGGVVVVFQEVSRTLFPFLLPPLLLLAHPARQAGTG